MHFADYLKSCSKSMPNWLGEAMLRMNFLSNNMFGPQVARFRQTIPNIDPNKRLIDMANYAIANVPYYRNKYKGLVITSIEQFVNEIEPITKKTVTAHQDEFKSDLAKDYIITSTSGTTSKPLTMLMPKNRYVTEMSFVGKAWNEAGWKFTPRATLRREHLKEGTIFEVNPFTKEYIFDGFNRSDDYCRKAWEVMKSRNISTIYSYPMSCYEFLKRLCDLGLDTSFIKLALLTSEPVTDIQYKFIKEKLDINISSFYGHTEKLIFARSLNGFSNFVIEPAYGFTELLGSDGLPVRNIGSEGELTGSTLYNYAMPLLRYRTNDWAEFGGNIIDSDGVEKMLITKIHGRRDNSVIYRNDGVTISDSNLTFHGEILEHLDGLQFVQNERGYLRCLIKPNSGFNDNDMELLKHTLSSAMLGDDFYSIECVDEFIIQPNGKFLLLVNTTL